MHIRTKLAAGLISILFVNLTVGLHGFSLLTQASARESRLRETSSLIVTTALVTQVQFKKQVQEWKNILLRGSEAGLFDDYFVRFEQEESRTRETLGQLIRLLAGDGQSHATASRFLEAHRRLGEDYRAALAFYRPQEPSSQLEVDRRVRGIDREPTDLIDQIVADVLDHKQRTLAAIDDATRTLERQILVLMVGVMSAAVIFLLWLIDRTIGQPIAMATVVARRVSTGDYSTPIQVSGSDEPAQMLAALKTMQENVTGALKRLSESEARFRLLLESTGEGIYGVDREGCCTFCNPAAARMLGYRTPDDLHGRNMHETVHHSQADGTHYPVSRCQAAVTYREGIAARVDDEVFWRADGSRFPVEYEANPIHQDGTLVGAVVTFFDISARKDAEAALRMAHDALAQERTQLAERVRCRTLELDRANAALARTARAKDEFLAAMSHELRTPLTSILGLSETMADGLLGQMSKQQDRAVHIIHENGTHLLDLINDILDMSRVASGQMQLHWDQVSVTQLCDASLRLIGPAAKCKALTVSTTLDPRACLVRGDSRRLKQMLVNLLGNAVKFTPSGGAIGLDVTANVQLQEVRIGIWDTGIGIPADQFDRLFQPFVQLDSRPARQHDGSGLGLALASAMAELHHGRIEVQSDVGRGSRFEIVLPWNPQAQTADQLPQEPDAHHDADANAPSPRRPRVLLVEDNESVLEMLSTYLRIKGCEVLAAGNGSDAIALAREQHPDLILMDVQMPVMDGLETTGRLRTDPALRRIPIIALTALAMPGDRERCLEAGMDDYLSKPLGLKELHRTVISWIDRTRAA
ncbi:response regulator [uncultured Lamprocystis sp.]|uniref:response regulator n=2 Tax=uncultured Lamprocystis sp. TaxID=543132 RepID=UPI0025DF80A2|nr:response regulator [uncultured Lamprocystis sp.]